MVQPLIALLVILVGGLEAVEWGRSQFSYSPRPVYYIESGVANSGGGGSPRQRLVIYHGSAKECDLVGDPEAVRWHLANVTSSAAVVKLSKQKMSLLVERCERVHAQLFSRDPEAYFSVLQPPKVEARVEWDRSGSSAASTLSNEVVTGQSGEAGASSSQSLWSLNMFNRILIFPGTKWCGQGSVAEHYSDIGYHAEADRCCRDHDLCLTVTGEYMSPGHCKNGLCNYSPVTRSPCECDKAFVRCLKSAKTRVANALGKVFFNVAGLTCYKFDHPIKRCVEYVDVAGSLPVSLPLWIVRALSIHPEPQRPRCRRYELDVTKPKMWQFFETVYDDAHSNSIVDNARSEEPRSYGYHRRPNSLSLFQKIVVDVFMSIIDPYY